MIFAIAAATRRLRYAMLLTSDYYYFAMPLRDIADDVFLISLLRG